MKREVKEEYAFSTQKNVKDSLTATSLSINNSDLIEIGIFDSQKTNKTDNEGNRKDSRHDKISAERKFDEYLLEAIDEALTSLGEAVKNTVYIQLENSFNMPKKEIPMQIDEFTDIIHKIFGLGASRLEIRIMKNLHSKIKVNIEMTQLEWPVSKWIVEEMSFTEYVYNAHKSYCGLQQKFEENHSTENDFE
jgi:hypothetical protein